MRNFICHLLLAACLASCTTKPIVISNSIEPILMLSPGQNFEFQISPWVSLHHFVYHLTRENEKQLRLRGRVRILDKDRHVMSDEFRNALQPVFAAYKPYIEKDLLFDEALQKIGRSLSFDGHSSLQDIKLMQSLKNIMPIYLDEYWPQHKQTNQSLYLKLQPLLEKYEATMATRLANAIGSSWGKEPIRVDISIYANWAGAYTANNPNLITLSATDPEVSGDYAFEILFHETLHTNPFGEKLYTTINEALLNVGVKNPRLWHNVLFYISGKITKEVFGIKNYTTYVTHTGISKRNQAVFDLIQMAWKTQGTFEERVTQLAYLLKTDL